MAMSEEQRKAASERMKAMHAAKKVNKEELNEPVVPVPDQAESVSQEDFKQLLEHVKKLESQLANKPKEERDEPRINQRGTMVGTFEKYVVNPENYPNPTERLSQEPRLASMAFPINYELIWDVNTTSYETKDGISTKEPRFSINLLRKVLDDEGNVTNKRYLLKKLIFHEDPQAAISVANQHGFDVNSVGEWEFLNEMRYLRVQDWLFDIFWPKSAVNKARREEVVDNTLVEVFEISSEDGGVKIPFDKMKRL